MKRKSTNNKRKKSQKDTGDTDIRKQALENMRQAKKNIGPERLDKLLLLIGKAMAQSKLDGSSATETNDKTQPSSDIQGNDIPIDRQKNLETIHTLMRSLNPESDLYKQLIKTLKSQPSSESPRPKGPR